MKDRGRHAQQQVPDRQHIVHSLKPYKHIYIYIYIYLFMYIYICIYIYIYTP